MPSTTCLRCNRPLKNPVAIERGMGAVCYRKHLFAQGMQENDKTPPDTIYTEFTGDVIVVRRENGCKEMNIRQHIIKHSPTGMEWGYAGSGCADFALNILYTFTNNAWFSMKFHQDFKFEFVAGLPRSGGYIPGTTIKDWIHEKVIEAADAEIGNPYLKQLQMEDLNKVVTADETASGMQVNGNGELIL